MAECAIYNTKPGLRVGRTVSYIHVSKASRAHTIIASMTITQYLGTGTLSRGRMGITPSLSTRVLTAPYLRDVNDKAAVVQSIEYIRGVLSKVQDLTWVVPGVNQTTSSFVNLVSHSFSMFGGLCNGTRTDCLVVASHHRYSRIEPLDGLLHDRRRRRTCWRQSCRGPRHQSIRRKCSVCALHGAQC